MASPVRSGTSEPLTAINVTPLVDVMLVLLVIFMITAKLDDQTALPLDLPQAASGEAAQQILSIRIDARGERSVNGQRVDEDSALRLIAVEVHGAHPDVRTIIQASTRASHGDVMRVLDVLRVLGIRKIAFAVEPEP